ncbi:MAG: tetratricopeptide repeat protein [Tannerellaceae bacterium]
MLKEEPHKYPNLAMLHKTMKYILYSFSFIYISLCIYGCNNKQAKKFTAIEISSQKAPIVNNLDKQYQHARSLQAAQSYSEAIDAFKACLTFNSNDEDIQKQLEPIVVNAMIQILNSYQSEGNPDGCIDYFYSLTENTPPLIHQYCMRDVYSLLGYAISRTERMSEAEEVTLKALDIPITNPTPQRLFRHYAYAAAVFFSNPDKQEDVIKWCNLAIEQANLSETPTSVQWITSMLGNLYKRTGKINEATDLLLQSVQEARKQKDLLGEANAYNALAELYLYWDLPQYANEYASLSVEKNLHKDDNPMEAGIAYITKAKILQQLGCTDSLSFFWEKADSCCKVLPYNSGQVMIDYNVGRFIVDRSLSTDSINKGIEMLKRVTTLATPTNRASAYHQLARGYFKLQQQQQGEAMLDSMYQLLNQSASPIYIEGAYTDALTHYIQKQEDQKIIQYATALLNEIDFRLDKQNAKKLAETIVKFQTEKKEQQLLLAQVELENKNLHIRLYLIAALAFIILTSAFFFYKRRMYLMRQQLMEQRLTAMLDNLEKVNQHSVQVEQQLTDILTEKDSRKEIEAVTPGLLKEKGEPKFRQRFEQLYPRFLPALKERIPNIGRKEELLSMLIVLEQDNHQIAALMGIAHSSVNMARYRLRQKFGLDKEESLDDVIKSML